MIMLPVYKTIRVDDRGEVWIKCCICQRWGHEACAGIDSDDSDEFTFDLCKITPGKRRLERTNARTIDLIQCDDSFLLEL